MALPLNAVITTKNGTKMVSAIDWMGLLLNIQMGIKNGGLKILNTLRKNSMPRSKL